MLVANRDRSTNRKSEWAELCCYRGRKTSARKGWVHSVGKGIPLLVRKVTHRRFPQWRFRSVVVFVLFYFFFFKGTTFYLIFPRFCCPCPFETCCYMFRKLNDRWRTKFILCQIADVRNRIENLTKQRQSSAAIIFSNVPEVWKDKKKTMNESINCCVLV